jgi:DNA-binding response OmpR family regulator
VGLHPAAGAAASLSEDSGVRVLIVEDDVPLGQALLQSFIRSGHTAQWLRSVGNARSTLAAGDFAAVLLDVELPDGIGYDVLSWMRSRNDLTPVLFLTVRDSIDERIRAFNAGADDYLTKPFSVDELIARVGAVIRRSVGSRSAVWELGPIRIDVTRQQVSVDGQPRDLTPKESALLLQLVQNAGTVVSRALLEESLFRSPESIESNVLEVLIHNLRRKLGGELIQTVRGVGYRIKTLEDSVR